MESDIFKGDKANLIRSRLLSLYWGMGTITRPITEEEIPLMAKFLSSGEWIENTTGEDLKKSLTALFHRQGDLLRAIFDKENGTVLGAIMAKGEGDTVSITHLWAVKNRFHELIKTLIVAEEKASRHYGYLRIFLTAMPLQKSFLIALGYKPRLLFTFSSYREELFNLFSKLYPLWIEAGGQEVKVLLGGDHLDEEIKNSLRDFPVKTDYLFLKYL